MGAPGSGKQRLPGVVNDLYNMNDYLQSPRGGAWYANEIEILDNPSTWDVQDAINNAIADYVFIYFSGHGFMDEWKNNLVCFKDYNVIDCNLFNPVSPRQLIIIDACRCYLPTISGIPGEVEKWQYADGYSEARELFDRYILGTGPGRMILHSTTEGEFAYDERNGRGGEFTLALLQCLFAEKTASGYYPVSVSRALDNTKKSLREANEPQLPCITFHDGNFEVPLAIVSANFIPFAEIERPQYITSRPKANSSSSDGLVLAAIAGLILWGLSD